MNDMSRETLGRPLTQAERGVLKKLLSVEFPGAEALREQIEIATVARAWGPESVSIDLCVPGDQNPASVPDGVLPLDAPIADASGEYLGELLVWVSGGLLSALEYAWVSDMPPRELPTPNNFSVSYKNQPGW